MRREREIREHRVDERERQARCRLRRRSSGELAGVSRAGLQPEVMEIEQVVLEKWDKLIRRSRAGLRREIRMVLGKSVQIVGQISTGP